jgi:hypothetical protein
MSKTRFSSDQPLPGDPPRMVEAIERLNALGIEFERKTVFHLKIDEWNFYPGRGTIVRDGCPGAEPDRGLDALLSRLHAAAACDPPKKSHLSQNEPHNLLYLNRLIH